MGFLSDLIGVAADAACGEDIGNDIRMMEMHNAMNENNSRIMQEMDHQDEMRRQQQRQDAMNMHFIRTRSY